jgi:hypothetical protein
MRYGRSTLSLFVLALHASCGGAAVPTAPGDDSEEPQMERIIKQLPSFKADIQEIFVRKGCTSVLNCHGIGQGGLTLGTNAVTNHLNLVNVPAESESQFLLVKPLDAVNSYVIIRLENRQTVGLQMPGDGGRLDSIDLTNLKTWINNGAPNN